MNGQNDLYLFFFQLITKKLKNKIKLIPNKYINFKTINIKNNYYGNQRNSIKQNRHA